MFVPCLCPSEHRSTMEEAVAGAVILLGTTFLPSTAAISGLAAWKRRWKTSPSVRNPGYF